MGRKCKPTEEKGNNIKKWRIGTELIRKSNPRKWLGQEIEEVIDLRIRKESSISPRYTP